MPYILLSTSSSDENYNADCDFAIVELTPDYVKWISDKVALFRTLKAADSALVELPFFDYHAAYYSTATIEEAFGEEIYKLTTPFLIPPFHTSKKIQQLPQEPMGSGRIILDSTNIQWIGYPKHCDFEIRTNEFITLKDLHDWLSKAEQQEQEVSHRKDSITDAE